MSVPGLIVPRLPRGLADERNRKRLIPSSLPKIHKNVVFSRVFQYLVNFGILEFYRKS